MLKKTRNLMAILFVSFATLLPSLGQTDESTDPDDPELGDDWVCCQSRSMGCFAIDGSYFPEDYAYYGDFCP